MYGEYIPFTKQTREYAKQKIVTFPRIFRLVDFVKTYCQLDTGRKLNVNRAFRTSFERLMYVPFRSVSRR